jgi:hypothetical protein
MCGTLNPRFKKGQLLKLSFTYFKINETVIEFWNSISLIQMRNCYLFSVCVKNVIHKEKTTNRNLGHSNSKSHGNIAYAYG